MLKEFPLDYTQIHHSSGFQTFRTHTVAPQTLILTLSLLNFTKYQCESLKLTPEILEVDVIGPAVVTNTVTHIV